MGCIELLENLGVRAQDERELVEFLRQVPVGSVFHHTCGYFLRHRIFVGPYANDFATWTAVHLGDRVDPYLSSLERVRSRLLDLLDAALDAGAAAEGRAPAAPA